MQLKLDLNLRYLFIYLTGYCYAAKARLGVEMLLAQPSKSTLHVINCAGFKSNSLVFLASFSR